MKKNYLLIKWRNKKIFTYLHKDWCWWFTFFLWFFWKWEAVEFRAYWALYKNIERDIFGQSWKALLLLHSIALWSSRLLAKFDADSPHENCLVNLCDMRFGNHFFVLFCSSKRHIPSQSDKNAREKCPAFYQLLTCFFSSLQTTHLCHSVSSFLFVHRRFWRFFVSVTASMCPTNAQGTPTSIFISSRAFRIYLFSLSKRNASVIPCCAVRLFF